MPDQTIAQRLERIDAIRRTLLHELRGLANHLADLDLLTGESESAIVRNDYVLITDGDRYLANVQEYATGTVVLTVKRRDVVQ